ncbi:Fe-S oxidoreductase [Elasticomyces elasticus]|uniref:tRNA 4-demethylwyosine synthase (AdoMet-dependent) n=1 Tax=Elasticomyces elasticus TaxID=574655 RepID=A0AAN7W5S9_9PEZI|nr:Fe-S oxidoreductase [Elasticomyces elasticus]
MEARLLLQLPDELMYLWHTHRTELLLSAGLIFAVVRLTLLWRSTRKKEALTPVALSPVDEKPRAVVEKASYQSRPKTAPKRVIGSKKAKSPTSQPIMDKIQPVVFYYTIGGTSKVYAEQLASPLQPPSEQVLAPELHDLSETDYDDFFISPPKSAASSTAHFYLFVIPSYDIDTQLNTFLEHLRDTHHDFRIDTAPLSGLAGYAVYGLGDKSSWPTEAEGFGKDAVEVDKWLAKLTGRKRGFPLGLGDVGEKHNGGVEARISEWTAGVKVVMEGLAKGEGLGEGVKGSGGAVESADEDEDGDADLDADDTIALPKKRKITRRSRTDDLEDLKAPIPVDFTTTRPSGKSTLPPPPKAMVPVNSPTYNSLTKQGYTIVGSHSGVKICRWTKSALRGRGSCYKYSFYGIASHLCTTWRWTVDPADLVFAGMKEGHYKKIKMMRGVPGVRAERFAEAMQIRHCALSLVGEPIFYPHINELLAMLHGEHISSFLVCNAQHPDELERLGPVTQLYVSIDASNKDSLRRIDRPLHRDFWERFIRCMDILRTKRFTHRTVFRLTLVKGFNIEEEAEGYAELVGRALPGFVEVKGVTYCGTSTAAGAGLSMQNVPFYEEVSAFVLSLEAALKRRGLDYGIAAEHAHSCCILLADRERFFRPTTSSQLVSSVDAASAEGRWHTLIDYPAFFRCLESGKAFGPGDYVAADPTPEWASWGRGGFDPRDERVDRKGRPKGTIEAAV